MAYSIQIDWHCVCGDSLGSHRTTPQGEECWGGCQRTSRDCNGFGYRPIPHDARTPAIEQMFQVAAETSLPKHFTCDLSTDYQTLMWPDAPQRFVWILRESGTDIVFLDGPGPFANQATLVEYRRQNNKDALYFFWDGSLLEKVTSTEALGLVYAEQLAYERAIGDSESPREGAAA